MRSAPVLHRRAIAPLLLSVIAACSSDESNAHRPDDPDAGVSQGTGRAVLAERARVLDAPALAALRRVRPSADQAEQLELEFALSELAGTLEGVSAGDVMIMGPSEPLPNGALLEVEDVSESGTGFVLRTRPAALGDAFEELEISLETTLANVTESSGAVDGGVSSTPQALELAFPFVFRGEGGPGQAEVSGSISIDSSIDLALDFDFLEFELKELSVSMGADETFVAELVAQGESTFEESTELGSISFAPITIILPIPVTPYTVPVVLTPRIALQAGVSGSVHGVVEASVLQEASFTAGLGFRDGEFQGFSESDSTFDFEQPSYEAAVNVRASAGPRLEVLLYGLVGPFVQADAFVELAANVEEGPPPCVRGVLDAGLRATAGVELLADYTTILLDERNPLAHFDGCSDDPDALRPAVTWARTFGREGSTGEVARAVIEASDGSLIVVGHSDLFADVTGFAASAWVLRLDPLGQVIWQRAFQRNALGMVRGVVEVPGGFLLTGSSGVMKLDSGGNVVWAKRYEGDPIVEITSVDAQPDGSFAVAGFSDTSTEGWAMGLDPEGEVVWSRRFTGQTFTRVRATAAGGYVVIGNLPDEFDVTLIELDANGDVVFARLLDNLFDANPDVPDDPLTTSDDYAYDVAPKPGGGYVVVGEGYGPYPLPEPTPVGYYGTWVADVDAQGNFGGLGSVTHRAPDQALYGGAAAVAVRPNGSTLVVGRRADTAADLLTNEDVLLVQGGTYDLLGGAGHDRIDTGTATGRGRGMPLALTADGGAILALTSNSFAARDQFWLVKLNRTGGINLPERTRVSGSAFTNTDAVSSPFEATPEDVEVTATSFEAEVSAETTDMVSAQQNP